MIDSGPYKSWPNLKYSDTIFGIDPNFYEKKRSWMHEVINDKESLLIVVGDSWTWGDSLCGIDIFNEDTYDKPERLNHIYGTLLSNRLNSDFVNLGECGCNNHSMLVKLTNVLKHNYLKYKKIYVVITLTENCRDINYDGSFNTWVKSLNENLNDFLKTYEFNMFCDFKNLFDSYKNYNILFLLGRNFTYSFDENKKFMKEFHLDKIWVDCLSHNFKDPYPTDVRFLSQTAIKPLDSFIRKNNMFDKMADDMIKEFDLAITAKKSLDTSPYNFHRFSRHPNKLGHKLWANYLLTVIQEKESKL